MNLDYFAVDGAHISHLLQAFISVIIAATG